MSNFRQFSKMFSAHLKMTLREKQAWFWGIFFPVILMVLFMIIFGGDAENEVKAEVAVVEEHPNAASQMFREQIAHLPAFVLKSEEPVSRAEADAWVKENEIAAAIILPESEDDHSLQLIVNKEKEQDMTTQMVSGVLLNLIQQTNLTVAGAEPTYQMEVQAVSAGGDDLEYVDFLLTGMIALSIAQGGLFGMVDLVELRRKGLLKRLRMTPAKMGLYGLSDMTMRMIFAVVQLVLLSLIGVFAFGASLHIDLLVLIIVFLAGSLSFNALGYFFSSFSKTTEAYMGMANIASFLMMFLSGVFFPVESLPGWLQPVAQVLPLTYFVDGLRDGMVYASGLASAAFWAGIGVLILWGAVSFVLGAWLYKARSIAAAR